MLLLASPLHSINNIARKLHLQGLAWKPTHSIAVHWFCIKTHFLTKTLATSCITDSLQPNHKLFTGDQAAADSFNYLLEPAMNLHKALDCIPAMVLYKQCVRGQSSCWHMYVRTYVLQLAAGILL
jgi:hypothetical protein